MRNNINKPGLFRSWIPKTPLSGNMPYAKGAKTVTGDVLGPGTAQIDKRSWIRHAARAEHVTGCTVGHAARAANEAKVRSVPKAGGAARVEVVGVMRCANQGCGHPAGMQPKPKTP